MLTSALVIRVPMEEQRQDVSDRSQVTRDFACSRHGLAQSGRDSTRPCEATRPESATKTNECLSIILLMLDDGRLEVVTL